MKQNYFPIILFNQIVYERTPDSLKRQAAIPEAGNHVLGSYIKSKDIEKVQEECEKFVTEVLKINQQ